MPRVSAKYAVGAALVVAALVAGCIPAWASPAERAGHSTSNAQLIANGEFSAGNSGFTSQYSYSSTAFETPETYTIGANPDTFNSSWPSLSPHSPATEMMIVNGATTASQVLWSETVQVATNSSYAFSYWLANLYPSPPVLRIAVNGTPIATRDAPSAIGTWTKFTIFWHSGSSTTAKFTIVDDNLNLSGNDLALDDISLSGASGSANALSCTPSITSVGQFKAEQHQTVVIRGSCLGSAPAFRAKDSSSLRIVDSRGWNACSTRDPGGDAVTCSVSRQSASEIEFTGFGGAYGAESHALDPGDDLLIEVWGSASIPAFYRTKVAIDLAAASAALTCERQDALKFNESTTTLEQRYGMGPFRGDAKVGLMILFFAAEQSMLTKSMLTNLRSCAAQPDAALAFVNGLDTSSVDVLASMIGGGVHSTVLDNLIVSAYETNAVTARLSGLLYTSQILSGNENKGLVYDFIPHAHATIDFLSGLSGSEIQSWSQADQGLFGSDGPFEQMSDSALKASWQGYANYAAYPGPLSPGQLSGLMYGATRDNTGRADATASMTAWFLANSSPPSTANPTEVVAWLAPLANMNMAIAAPTAAFLYSVENWISAGETVAATALFIGADLATSGLLTPYLVGLRFGTAADVALATASEDAPTFYKLLKGVSEGVRAAKAVFEKETDTVGARAWSAMESEQDILGNVKNLKESPGQKKALAYDLAIEHNTCVEAVVRLLQEHDLYFWEGKTEIVLLNSPSIPVAENILKYSPETFIGRSHISVAVLLTAVVAQFGRKITFGS